MDRQGFSSEESDMRGGIGVDVGAEEGAWNDEEAEAERHESSDDHWQFDVEEVAEEDGGYVEELAEGGGGDVREEVEAERHEASDDESDVEELADDGGDGEDEAERPAPSPIAHSADAALGALSSCE